MTEEFKQGDAVKWRSHGGEAHGTVEKKQTTRMTIKGHTVAASPQNPQFIVRTAEGKKAAHKPAALEKE